MNYRVQNLIRVTKDSEPVCELNEMGKLPIWNHGCMLFVCGKSDGNGLPEISRMTGRRRRRREREREFSFACWG